MTFAGLPATLYAPGCIVFAMAYRAAVVGGSGYMGAEVLRLLAAHPELEVGAVGAASNAGARVGELFPGFDAAYPGLRYEALTARDLAGYDVVFCALPHGESQRLVPDLVGAVGHVVDLAADFRVPAPLYATWYGARHAAADLLTQFAYGLPELFRDELRSARHVAAPGCYPTAASLALAPALAAGAIEEHGIVVDAVSGVSGRGRGLSAPSLYAEANENALAYGLLDHRHTGEMEHALGRVGGREVVLLFTPHLVPMTRGILTTAYARLTSSSSTPAMLDTYRDYFRDEPFVRVVDEPPGTKATLGSNVARVTVRVADRTGTLLAIAALDNLVKGGSGQAIQATNALLGLPETTGLPVVGVTP